MRQPSRRQPSRRQSSSRQPSSHQSSRRTFLRVSAGTAAVALTGCVGGQSADPAATSTETTTGTTTGATTDEPPSSTTDETEETTTENPDSEHVAWRLDLDGEVRLGPAVLGDSLYVGDSSGVLRALDPGDGTERWRFDTGASFFRGTGTDYSPVLAEDALYAVSGNRAGAHGDDFAVHVLDAETGDERWSVERGFPSFLSLLGVAGNRVFVGTSDDQLGGRDETLLALDADTGEERWTADVGDARGATVTADAVYVGASDWIDAYDAADGTRRWTRELDGRVLGPETGDGVVYAGYRSGRESGALALDPESGETRWRVEEWFVTSMLADESLYVGGERVAAFAPDGTERWRYDAGGLLSKGALVGDSLYVGGNPLTALSTDDGAARWSNPVNAEFGVVEAASEAVVAVQRENGTVIDAFDAETGDRRFTFDVGGKWLSPVDARSGTVYAGSDAGVLYALRA